MEFLCDLAMQLASNPGATQAAESHYETAAREELKYQVMEICIGGLCVRKYRSAGHP